MADSDVQASQGAAASAEEPALPKLTPHEFRQYNWMAERMEYFHNHFRQQWTTMYTACEKAKRPRNMTLRQFLTLGQEFCSHLTMHHGIEERHMFPMLAKKMPRFKEEVELPGQHRQIHRGLVEMEGYIGECESGAREFRLTELKKVMDGFGAVLWQHLDEEVQELGAENMRKYWTLEEMRRMRNW